MFRAKVTEVDIDDNKYGAVRVFIPEIMTSEDPEYDEETMGLIAYPANNPVGGRNTKDLDGDSNYQGCVYVPAKGSWVWVFFENGNQNKPYYFAALDIENSMLPAENRGMESPSKVTTIFKSNKGRAIVISDSEDVARTEMTGKKRSISTPPSGDASSVLAITGNQSVIVINEANGADQILIMMHSGNYISLDGSNGSLGMSFSGDINIKAGGNLNLQAGGKLNVKSAADVNVQGNGAVNVKSSGNVAVQGGGNLSLKGGGVVSADGTQFLAQSGMSGPASGADSANPSGGRK